MMCSFTKFSFFSVNISVNFSVAFQGNIFHRFPANFADLTVKIGGFSKVIKVDFFLWGKSISILTSHKPYLGSCNLPQRILYFRETWWRTNVKMDEGGDVSYDLGTLIKVFSNNTPSLSPVSTISRLLKYIVKCNFLQSI